MDYVRHKCAADTQLCFPLKVSENMNELSYKLVSRKSCRLIIRLFAIFPLCTVYKTISFQLFDKHGNSTVYYILTRLTFYISSLDTHSLVSIRFTNKLLKALYKFWKIISNICVVIYTYYRVYVIQLLFTLVWYVYVSTERRTISPHYVWMRNRKP